MPGFVTKVLDKLVKPGDHYYLETTLGRYRTDMRQFHGVQRFPKRHMHKRVTCRLFTAVPTGAEPVTHLLKVTLVSEDFNNGR